MDKTKLYRFIGKKINPNPDDVLPIDVCLKCGRKLEDYKVSTRLEHDEHFHPEPKRNRVSVFFHSGAGIMIIALVVMTTLIIVGISATNELDKEAYDQNYRKFIADCNVDFGNIGKNFTKNNFSDEQFELFEKRWNECGVTSFTVYNDERVIKQNFTINNDKLIPSIIHDYDQFKSNQLKQNFTITLLSQKNSTR